MKMKSMFSGLGAKMALATLALGMTMPKWRWPRWRLA